MIELFYPRYIGERLSHTLETSKAVLLYGPRQCGKTTLAKCMAAPDKYKYISFDEKAQRESALTDPVGFFAHLPKYTILDEVQQILDIALELKHEIDNTGDAAKRFLLTGSANLRLMPKLSNALVGRMQLVRLHPLAQCELGGKPVRLLDDLFSGKPDGANSGGKDAGEAKKNLPIRTAAIQHNATNLLQRIEIGGFPEASILLRRKMLAGATGSERQMVLPFTATARIDDHARWYRDYARNLAVSDLGRLRRIKDMKGIHQLLKYAAALTATLFNSSAIARRLQTTHPTIQSRVDLLENMFLLKMLPPWRNNLHARLAKTPKLHFADTGLAMALLGMDAQKLQKNRALFGQMAETFVFQELRRMGSWHEERLSFSHFRDRDGTEVDIVIEKGPQIAGVEVKIGASIGEHDFRGLRKLAQTAGSNFVSGVVLYNGIDTMPFGKGLWAMPLSRLWGGD